jgi:sugar-specific transcriptional regulator TrmB
VIDTIRKQIQERLDQLLREAEKLRSALAALGPDGASPVPQQQAPARRQSTSMPTRRTRTTRTSGGRRRTPAGATKSKVLAALSADKGMTAAEVAAATGLPRPSVSTMLSRLAKSGEVRKAERGYVLP